jgi:hypothetical protein
MAADPVATAAPEPRYRFAPAYAFACAGALLFLLLLTAQWPLTGLLEWTRLLAVVAIPGWLAIGLYLVNRNHGALRVTRRASALLGLFAVGLGLLSSVVLAMLLFAIDRNTGIAFVAAAVVAVILLDRGLSGGK